jgi:hypothetical protein
MIEEVFAFCHKNYLSDKEVLPLLHLSKSFERPQTKYHHTHRSPTKKEAHTECKRRMSIPETKEINTKYIRDTLLLNEAKSISKMNKTINNDAKIEAKKVKKQKHIITQSYRKQCQQNRYAYAQNNPIARLYRDNIKTTILSAVLLEDRHILKQYDSKHVQEAFTDEEIKSYIQPYRYFRRKPNIREDEQN